MSQVYIGTFAIVLPTISGTVTATNGMPVAGVVIRPSGGLQPVSTDEYGRYELGVPPGWSGTVTPQFGSYMFVPGARSYTNLTASITGQDYVMTGSFAPYLGAFMQDGALALQWDGIQGITYELWCSTNLTDWVPVGGPVHGTNGLMELLVPSGDEPAMFYRLRAGN